MKLEKYDQNWAGYVNSGNLVCVTVYKKGALEIISRLSKISSKKEGSHAHTKTA